MSTAAPAQRPPQTIARHDGAGPLPSARTTASSEPSTNVSPGPSDNVSWNNETHCVQMPIANAHSSDSREDAPSARAMQNNSTIVVAPNNAGSVIATSACWMTNCPSTYVASLPTRAL